MDFGLELSVFNPSIEISACLLKQLKHGPLLEVYENECIELFSTYISLKK